MLAAIAVSGTVAAFVISRWGAMRQALTDNDDAGDET
jgi:hypothetical protein